MAKEKSSGKVGKSSNEKVVFNSGSKKKRTSIGSSKQSRAKGKQAVRNRRGR